MDCVAALWLFPCGHLAIRLDDWGEGSFPRPPEHVPQDLPDVIYDGAFDCPSVLLPITAPANPVPRAITSQMAGSLAEPALQPVQLCGHGQQDDSVLRGHVASLEEPAERSHPEHLCLAQYSDFHAELYGSDSGSGSEQEVREVPGTVPSPKRSSSIWRGWRPQDQDLRSVRY